MGTNVNDGYFEILEESDGIYVDLYEAKEGGKKTLSCLR